MHINKNALFLVRIFEKGFLHFHAMGQKPHYKYFQKFALMSCNQKG